VEWFGNPRGYNISYREVGGLVSGGRWRSVTIDDHTANSHILENLEEFSKYEIITQAYNDVGSSKPSPIAVEHTRESGKFLASRLMVSVTEFISMIKIFHIRLPNFCNFVCKTDGPSGMLIEGICHIFTNVNNLYSI
jgi:hypothetical protein